MRALRALIVIGTALACASPAPADPLYCSTWQQITTCSSPDGYLSRQALDDIAMAGLHHDDGRAVARALGGPAGSRKPFSDRIAAVLGQERALCRAVFLT